MGRDAVSIASQLDTYDLTEASAWGEAVEAPGKDKLTELGTSDTGARENWEEMAPGVAAMTGVGACHIYGPGEGSCEYQSRKMTAAGKRISPHRMYHIARPRQSSSLPKAFWMR